MKVFVEYKDAYNFIKWVDYNAPEKIKRAVEYEIVWTNEPKESAVVTFIKKDGEIDAYDLFLAYTRAKTDL